MASLPLNDDNAVYKQSFRLSQRISILGQTSKANIPITHYNDENIILQTLFKEP